MLGLSKSRKLKAQAKAKALAEQQALEQQQHQHQEPEQEPEQEQEQVHSAEAPSNQTTQMNDPEDETSETPSSSAQYEHSFSFAGAGWMMVYEFGVAKALQQHGIHTKSRFIGTSAGSLASVGLTLDNDFDAIVDTVINEYVPEVYRNLRGPFKMRKYLVHALKKHGNLHRFEDLNNEPGKATFVYTSLSAMKARRRSCGFRSKDHLLKTLIASCCATPLVGLPFMLDGEFVMDGGVLANQPLFPDDPEGKHTVTVSPNILSDADIKPSQYVPPWWTMYPPSQQDMRWAYSLGQEDALRWLVAQGLVGEDVPATSPLLPPQSTVTDQDDESEEVTERALALAPQHASPATTAVWKTPSGKFLGYRGVDEQFYRALMVGAIVYAVLASMSRKWKHSAAKMPGRRALRARMRTTSEIVTAMTTNQEIPAAKSSQMLAFVAVVSTAAMVSAT